MITYDKKTKQYCFFLTKTRKLEMSEDEYKHFEKLIKNPPPEIKLTDPPKPWSPCSGKGCDHSSHKQNQKTGYYESLLDDLDNVESGLSEWELTFLQSLHDWDGMWTDHQCDKLEEIWEKHC